jgi:hypothetical protein
VSAKYRKKPVVVEAMLWDGGAAEATLIIQWVLDGGGTARYHERHDQGLWSRPDEIRIDTLEGTMTANRGDWIIRGVKGEFYPCKPDIFEATYEAVTA